MRPFPPEMEAVAAPLAMDNVDTDAVIPARFLKTTRRSGLGAGLFADLRRDARLWPEGFVLDRPPFDGARVLAAGRNFGCGSSREHAAWALLDAGIVCVVAESLADIFRSNCLQNGILPAEAPDAAAMAEIRAAAAEGRPMRVSLEALEISLDNRSWPLRVDPAGREALLAGRDAVDETLRAGAAIEAHEARRAAAEPWLAAPPPLPPRPA